MEQKLTVAGAKVPANKTAFSAVIRSNGYKKMLENTIADKRTRETFITNMVTMVSQNPLLQNCDSVSLISAGLQAVNLGLPLSPTLGFAWVVPYKGRAQFQIGWKGLVQLAIRSGQFQHIDCGAVYDGEFTGYSDDREPTFKWDDSKHNGEITGYYATFRLTNGFKKTIYWTKDEVIRHKQKFSRAGVNSPWTTNFDSMACKTVLRSLLSKWAPISIDSPIQQALDVDQKVFHADGEGYFDDNPNASSAPDNAAHGLRNTIQVEDTEKPATQAENAPEEAEEHSEDKDNATAFIDDEDLPY